MKKIIAFGKKLFEYTLSLTLKPWAKLALYIIALTESIFFPLPTDMWLWPMCLAKPSQAIILSLKTALFSVVGALLGYALGLYFAAPLLEWMGSQGPQWVDTLSKIKGSTFELVMIGAISFLPFKIVTITAGVVSAPFSPFILACLIGRIIRFVVPGIGFYFFGEKMDQWLRKNFSLFSTLVGFVIVAYLIFKWFK